MGKNYFLCPYSVQLFTYVNSFNPQKNTKRYTIIAPILI